MSRSRSLSPADEYDARNRNSYSGDDGDWSELRTALSLGTYVASCDQEDQYGDQEAPNSAE